MSAETTTDASEIAKFEAMADEWWDPKGKFRPLHMLNPCRLDYVVSQIAAQFGRDRAAPRPFEGLSILDIGCGGGLMSEPMARLGATVTGIDPAPRNVAVAHLHAERSDLAIDYRAATAQDIVAEGASFDAVLTLEVVEHVPDPQAYLDAAAQLVGSGGLMIASTINRTARSYVMAILGAEYVIRWLPKGTHEWRKFVSPDELGLMLGRAGLAPVDRTGFVFDPLGWRWRLSGRDLSVNYVMTAVRAAAAEGS